LWFDIRYITVIQDIMNVPIEPITTIVNPNLIIKQNNITLPVVSTKIGTLSNLLDQPFPVLWDFIPIVNNSKATMMF